MTKNLGFRTSLYVSYERDDGDGDDDDDEFYKKSPIDARVELVVKKKRALLHSDGDNQGGKKTPQ
jgi:hypothetical protein